MDIAQFVVNVNSAQPERLMSFYRDTLALTPRFDITPGAFMAGSSSFVALIIEGHDKVSEKTREPERVLLNFVVQDIAGEVNRLESRGVRFIRTSYEVPGAGTFATFADPDGNYCQLAQLSA